MRRGEREQEYAPTYICSHLTSVPDTEQAAALRLLHCSCTAPTAPTAPPAPTTGTFTCLPTHVTYRSTCLPTYLSSFPRDGSPTHSPAHPHKQTRTHPRTHRGTLHCSVAARYNSLEPSTIHHHHSSHLVPALVSQCNGAWLSRLAHGKSHSAWRAPNLHLSCHFISTAIASPRPCRPPPGGALEKQR